MKHAIIMAAAALALAGCSKPATNQFAAMCNYQKEHDPDSYAHVESFCGSPGQLPDEYKMQLVAAYKQVVEARKAAGVEAPR